MKSFMTVRSMLSICSENPVPQAGKTRARLNLEERRRRPNAAFQRSADVGSRPDAAVASLRRVFREPDGLLHRVSSANAQHRQLVMNDSVRVACWSSSTSTAR